MQSGRRVDGATSRRDGNGVFTGIIEGVGRVDRLSETVPGAFELHLRTPLAGELAPGASLAVNGCCLTATAIHGDLLRFDLLAETLRRTNLGDVRPGDDVNLERPMSANGRFDGHIVQGHVDTASPVRAVEAVGRDHRLEIALPDAWARYVVHKGSVAVNGISLTVAELTAAGFVLWIIPHTWEVTNLRGLAPGARVNLEFDLVAKYVERMVVAAR